MNLLKQNLADEEIIGLFEKRDERGIEELSRKYRKLLKSIGTRFLPDTRDVEECINDTLLCVWNAIPPARPVNLRAYLVTSFRRKMISRFRADHSQKRSAILSELPWNECENAEITQMIGTDPEEVLEDIWLRNVLNAFLEDLPERSRFLFVGRYYMGMSIRELSKLLNISQSLVNLELSKMRDTLKQYLKEQ